MRPGTRVTDTMLALLGRDAAGPALALLPTAVGTWCATLGTGRRILDGLLWAVALAPGLGSLRHLVHVALVGVRYPRPRTHGRRGWPPHARPGPVRVRATAYRGLDARRPRRRM